MSTRAVTPSPSTACASADAPPPCATLVGAVTRSKKKAPTNLFIAPVAAGVRGRVGCAPLTPHLSPFSASYLADSTLAPALAPPSSHVQLPLSRPPLVPARRIQSESAAPCERCGIPLRDSRAPADRCTEWESRFRLTLAAAARRMTTRPCYAALPAPTQLRRSR